MPLLRIRVINNISQVKDQDYIFIYDVIYNPFGLAFKYMRPWPSIFMFVFLGIGQKDNSERFFLAGKGIIGEKRQKKYTRKNEDK